jgi:hypothetical protein
MNKMTKSLIATLAVFAFFVGSARADWNPGDPYKMHFPQLPDPFGWDVAVSTLNPPPPAAVADDWLCTETGPVSDLHIWFSMQGDQPFNPSLMAFTIWSDIPGTATNYSRPGTLLWNQIFSPADFTIRLYGTGDQGYYDPNNGTILPADHFNIWQLNLSITNPAVIPFVQQRGQVYWLGVNFEPVWGDVGWKTSTNHFNDDAVWWDFQSGQWRELFDPATGRSMDMAFVITTVPEPAVMALLLVGAGFLGFRRLRRNLTD